MTQRRPIPLPFTLAEIELRERQIASRNGIDYDASDRAWLRQEAIRELATGVDATPIRSTATIDQLFAATRAATECFGAGWSDAQHCRRVA